MIILGIVLALDLIVGWGIIVPLQLFPGQAIAQAYESWRALDFASSGNIHLAWPPFMALLQLPLALWPWLRLGGMAASVVSALAGAGSAAILYVIARRRGWPRWMGGVLVALYTLNPMVLYYAANGMAEMAFASLALLILAMYWEWHRSGRWVMIAGMGLTMAVALATRYEGLILAVALGLLLIAHLFTDRRGTMAQAEGTMLAYLSPIVYMIFLWFCWQGRLDGSSFDLAREKYPIMASEGYALALFEQVAVSAGNLQSAFGPMVGRIGQFFPAFTILSLGVGLAACIWKDKSGLGLILLAWCLPLFVIGRAMLEQSPMTLGPLVVLIPIGFLLLIWAGWRLKANKFVLMAGLCLLSASNICTGLIMRESPADGYERAFVRVLGGERWDGWVAEGALGRAVAELDPAMRVLADDRDAYPVIYFSGRSEGFIVPADPRFEEALRHPWGAVDAILVSRPASTGTPDYINTTYPGLYADGAPWARLAAEAGPWRLYWVASEWPQAWPLEAQFGHVSAALPAWLVFILRALVGGLLILVLLWILRRLNRQISFPIPEERLAQPVTAVSSPPRVFSGWIAVPDNRLISRADVFKLAFLMAEWLTLLVLTFYTLSTLPFLLVVGAGMVHWLNHDFRKAR